LSPNTAGPSDQGRARSDPGEGDTMTDIKDFKVLCFYHTKESSEMKIMARTPEDAAEIARIQFGRQFTDKCILDTVEVIV
jgi:hypothetical protein